MNPNELKKFAADRFVKHQRVLNLWQTLAENFYPERADFTQDHSPGEELGIGLASSSPIIIRRDLANSFEAMLRDGRWFEIGVDGNSDHMGKAWLEFASDRMFKLMNHRVANFRRATKEGDHDYTTFGNAVISVEANKFKTGLLYRSWHLRDCAWWDGDEGQVGGLVRRWKPKLYEAASYFGIENLHPDIQQKIKDHKSFDEMDIRHFDITSTMYGDEEYMRFDRVSCWLDVVNEVMIKVEGRKSKTYVVPRFQTIAGSPYAYSLATVVGLPEARTLQSMTHTLLEAGERLARPPLIATEKVIRGDANLFSDGITYISADHDERMHGAPIRPLNLSTGGFPYGLEMRDNVLEVLSSAFYLNKISLPETTHEMTAYEVSERMKQYRRENLPLFAPMEHEYNGQLCETSFDILMDMGMFGSHQDIPDSLKEKEVIFHFQSPLSQSQEEKKATTFSQVSALLAEAAQHDESVAMNVDFDTAIRDAIDGVGAPANWLNQVEKVDQMKQQQAQIQQAAMESEMVANEG